jgi:hypothetical protein
VHEGGFSVSADRDGGLRFQRPDGREVAQARSNPNGEIAAPPVTRCGLVPLSRGESLDRDHVVWALGQRPMLRRQGPIDC